jgi:hypothetical protein
MKLGSYVDNSLPAWGVFHHSQLTPLSLVGLSSPSTLSGLRASEEAFNHPPINRLDRPSHLAGPLLRELKSLAISALRWRLN